jgi:G3E family GTPase
MDGRIPLTIVTGFLGSGKTTLIRHLLTDSPFANAAIVVNELGAVGIDHLLLRKTEDRITLLRDGCACCARRDDLVEVLVALARRYDRSVQPSFDRVLLETSGMADPAPILHTIVTDPLLAHRFRVDRTLVTLDAIAGAQNIVLYDEAISQITAADTIVITKGDLTTPEKIASLAEEASGINPSAALVVATHGKVESVELTPELPLSRSAGKPHHEPQMCLHAPGAVSSLVLEWNDPISWPMLGLWLTMLLHRHGERVLRIKGLLDVGEDGPLLLEGVQHVVHAPRHLPTWPDATRQSRLVFIVRDLPPQRIRDSFEAFQAAATSV